MQWLSTDEVALRLGVKPASIYAYVSRGLLTSHRTDDGRTSRFDAAEVEQLALRGRPRQSTQADQAPTLDIRIRTGVTRIEGHRIHFRGYDALELATTVSFEQAAALLWTGLLPANPTPWRSNPIDVGVTRELTIRDRMRLVAAHAAVGDRSRRDARSTIEEGQRLIAALIDSLPIAGDGRTPRLELPSGAVRGTLAGRLWARLTPQRATPAMMTVLNASMVLLADHEMAASTLAARVAASTRAGVHGVVAAGMGTLSGPLHGGESQRCRRTLQSVRHGNASAAVTLALDLFGRVPGFGQVLYPKGDPRAVVLLQLLRSAAPEHPVMRAVDGLIRTCAMRRLPPPNVDLALAALGAVAGMPDDAGEAIFTPARIVGWLAHALEEYDERPLRFRPRATYTGVAP